MKARDDALDGLRLLGRTIDNSQVVREVDPRSGRDLWRLLWLGAALVAGLVLYAWPTLELRRTGAAKAEMSRQRESLLEQNRKLRLEKASLENLHRVEAIALRNLGLRRPAPADVVVVERPVVAAPPGAVASEEDAGTARN